VFLLLIASTLLVYGVKKEGEDHIDRLLKLQKIKDLGLIDDIEYNTRKSQILDEYLGVTEIKDKCKTPKYRYVTDYNVGRVVGDNNTNNGSWKMPVVWTPQVKWLVSLMGSNMPRSYDDRLPATGKLFWFTAKYLRERPVDPNRNNSIVAFDDQVAIQERALTHIGLNLYDGGVWAVALALSGLSELVDVYYRNVLYTSTTGSNDFADGLESIRASSFLSSRDYFYGKDQISDKSLAKVKMPGNMTFVHKKDPKCCGVCCQVVADKEIPGGFFYRMIGPTYRMWDPFQGSYGWQWRAIPAGPNNDSTTTWNLAGVIHWNDWKPITGENVWAAMLAPMQTLLIKNCTHVRTFSKFEEAPDEIQFSITILPALKALKSTLGSLYHCPKGAEMFPVDEDEKTNVSNENNFSAYAALKATYFIFDNFYKGSDSYLDNAKKDIKDLMDGLDQWFQSKLMPADINGKKVVSQGGHVTFAGSYEYQKGDQAFAVDCQTWGLLNMGVKRMDGAYGASTAYNIWKATKELSGYYTKEGKLGGVGYTVRSNATNATKVWSGEWTWGAVFMCKRIGQEYIDAGMSMYGNEMLADAKSMIDEMGKDAKVDEDGVWIEGGGLQQCDGSYLYANARFFIPWGWYANPIGATSSTGWAVFNDYEYNPFQLGGGWNTTFYKTQCKDWVPDKTILQNLAKFYDYKFDPKKFYHNI
jgi:hypothetical protein